MDNENKLFFNLQKISEIGDLPDNWNNNGAVRFSGGLLNKAREIICRLPVQPDIFPTAQDSIQFEYENNENDYLEFELFADGKIKMFYFSCDGVEETKNISINEIVGCIYYKSHKMENGKVPLNESTITV